MLLDKQGAAEDSHDPVDVSFKFHFMLDYCNNAVSAYSRIDLYSDGSLEVSPECGNSKVLFNPFEEKFYLPAVLVKEYNLFGRQEEIICVKDKTSLQVGDIRYNTSYPGREIGSVALAEKPNGVILENISILRHIQSVFNHELGFGFLSYDKEGSKFLNLMKPLQIPVPTIEYISGQRLIINDIHCIHIMNGGIRDVYHDWNLCHYIKLGMQFDAGLCTPEFCPVINTHTKVNRGGIKRIELAANAELPVYPSFLSKRYHVIGELLEHMSVSIGVASGENITVYRILAKAKMKGLLAVGRSNVNTEFNKSLLTNFKRH